MASLAISLENLLNAASSTMGRESVLKAASSAISLEFLLKAAEDNFESGNHEDALRLANIAAQIHSEFQGIDKFVTAYGIHVAAMRKDFNGEVDSLAVLGIPSEGTSSSMEIPRIANQYRRLAVLVHPDNNNCVAAEGAFKLVSNAYRQISKRWVQPPSHRPQPTSLSLFGSGAPDRTPPRSLFHTQDGRLGDFCRHCGSPLEDDGACPLLGCPSQRRCRRNSRTRE